MSPAGPSDGPLREGRGAVLLSVHAQPGARREGVAGLHGGRVRIRTKAPAVDGKANDELVRIVARAFGLVRRDVELVSGASSRRKELALGALDLTAARARLDAILAESGDAA